MSSRLKSELMETMCWPGLTAYGSPWVRQATNIGGLLVVNNAYEENTAGLD
jgi:hypothetical protein